MAKLSAFFAFWYLLNVCRAQPLCPNIIEFEENNKDFLGQDYLESKSPGVNSYTNYLANTSKQLSNGKFGEVFQLKYNEKIVFKKLIIYTKEDEKYYYREIEMLRFICEHEVEEYKVLTVCRSHAIAAFKGCIFDLKKFYLFQEKMSFSLDDVTIQSAFRDKPPLEKLRIMLDIIDRFIVLHARGVIHSDVKPANIMMKYMDFTEFRIIDLGFADKEDKYYNGGTGGYFPPEMYGLDEEKYKLHPRVDVFALGVTFTQMAGLFDLRLTYIKENMQTNTDNWKQHYADKIHKRLEEIFNSDKNLDIIIPCIMQALNLDADSRIQSMKNFANILISIMITIKNYEKFLKDYFQKFQNENSNNEFFGYWKSELVLEFGTPEQIKQYGPKDHLYRTHEESKGKLLQSQSQSQSQSQKLPYLHQSQQLEQLKESELLRLQKSQKESELQREKYLELQQHRKIKQNTEQKQSIKSKNTIQQFNLQSKFDTPNALKKQSTNNNSFLPPINQNRIKQKLIV